MPRNDGSTTTSERGITKRTGTTGTSYRVRVSAIDARTGQRRVVQGSFPTFKAARDFKRRTAHELASGSYTEPSTELVRDVLAHWLASADLAANTRIAYERVIRRIINPAIGDVQLGRLTGRQVQALYGEPRQASTARHIQAALNGALNLAVQEELIERNVAAGLQAARVDDDGDHDLVIWTPEELATFLTAAADHPLSPLFIVAVKTGMRLGELCAVQWRDITLDLARVFVRKGKTDAARRRVSIDLETVDLLRDVQTEQARRRDILGPAWTEADRVFERGDGTPVSPRTVQSVMTRIVERTGLPHATPHTLRHIHATVLLQAGIAPHIVAERLGHASPAITLAVYAHVLPDDERRVAELMPSLIPSVQMRSKRASGE